MKLKEFFKKHFTGGIIYEDPIELEETPDFITELQRITTNDIKIGPPDEVELTNVIKNLKGGKAASDIPIVYIKQSMSSREFVEEIVKLYGTIWETTSILFQKDGGTHDLLHYGKVQEKEKLMTQKHIEDYKSVPPCVKL